MIMICCFISRSFTSVIMKCYIYISTYQNYGQVDSTELPETPEVTEMRENFTKVTKYLTKFKETLINYVWEKFHVKKQ